MKKIIFGFLLGAILFGSVSAYAGTGSNLLEVFYNVKDIKINYASQAPSKKPFIFEGTTYVPLRFISEALGQQVLWDEKNQTVNINDCIHRQPDTIRPTSYICIVNRRVFYPEGVTFDGTVITSESTEAYWLLPFVIIKNGESIMNISVRTGIVMGELMDPNDTSGKDPFEFIRPYITGYYPHK